MPGKFMGKTAGKTALFGSLSLLLYFVIFSNQDLVTKYFTKGRWYNWEKFIQTRDLTFKQKISLLEQGVQSQNDPEIIRKYQEHRARISRKKSGGAASPSRVEKEHLADLLNFVISLSPPEKRKIIAALRKVRPETAGLITENTLLGALRYAVLPVLTAFLFSFIHGGFAGNFWAFLGIEAVKKKEEG